MEALKGQNQILLFRLLKDATTKKAAKMAFQTEHETSESADAEVTQTKDGPISVSAGIEEEITFNCIMARGDEVDEMLRQAMREKEIVEVWEVDITEKSEEERYPAEYRQGLVTERSKTANAEDLIEVEYSFTTNGISQSGEVTLTSEQEEVIQYAFRDTDEYTEGV